MSNIVSKNVNAMTLQEVIATLVFVSCTTNLRVGRRSKRAAEVFLPEGCVLSFSLTIPNLVWFVRIFYLDFCRQLRTAVVRGNHS